VSRKSITSSAVLLSLLLPCAATAQGAQPAAEQAAAPIPTASNAPRRATPPDPLRNTQPAVTDDWLTFGHDQQRTGWNNADTTFNRKNVSRLKLLWDAQLSAVPSPHALQTLTEPVVVSGVATPAGAKTMVFTISGDGKLFAIDAKDGKVLWQKQYDNPYKPIREATRLCANAEQATPTVDQDKGIIYFTTADGNLRGVALNDGSEKLTPTPIVAPFSRNWSLNLVNDVVYTSAARGCGGSEAEPIESGHVAAADVSDPTYVKVEQFYTGLGRPAGPWGRGGPVLGPQGLYVQTADGLADPASGFWGNTVIAVRPGAKGAADSFTPSNWRYLNAHDLDLGSGSSTIFTFKGKALLVTGAKESVLYLLDANALGGGAPEHGKALYTTPKLGNDADSLEQRGIWGGISTWEAPSGDRFIYAPLLNKPAEKAPAFPIVNGDVSEGSVMAFKVVQTGNDFSLAPVWMSGVVQAPDMITIANGVVFTLGTGEQTIQNPKPPIANNLAWSQFRTTPVGHEILYAFDAESGKPLYSSRKLLPNWVHFSQPVVSNGKVFVVSYDAHVYAFGLKSWGRPATSSQPEGPAAR
jgi:outer membrane protein assembly factor BamB